MNAAWDKAFPDILHDGAGRRTPQRMRLGLSAWTTPPWAQDIGCDADATSIIALLDTPPAALVVLDLPAGMASPLSARHPAWAVERHTRQWPLSKGEDPVESWPQHRRKQWRRAAREGMVAETTRDVALLVELHQASRHRKGLRSDGQRLSRLLTHLMEEPDTRAWIVRSGTGLVLAGGVFHGADDGRCIYGFGGQFRAAEPGESSRATVLLIGTAMQHAAGEGAHTFDFGGSQDPGVDRFYAEFGAAKVPKTRLVHMHKAWRPLLRWRRPDLFPA